nr:MAG TPA: hypothetical protein [Caudoviricetes sp.]
MHSRTERLLFAILLYMFTYFVLSINIIFGGFSSPAVPKKSAPLSWLENLDSN